MASGKWVDINDTALHNYRQNKKNIKQQSTKLRTYQIMVSSQATDDKAYN